MKRSEVSILLTKIAAFDQRTIGEADVEAWAEALGDSVGIADALDAVTNHFRTSHERLMPIHILTAAAAVRRERLQRAGTPPMPGDLTWQQEKDWRQLWCAKVKDGATPTDAATAASSAMRLPLELEPVPVPLEERDRLINALAAANSLPKPERRPRRKRVEFVDDKQVAT